MLIVPSPVILRESTNKALFVGLARRRLQLHTLYMWNDLSDDKSQRIVANVSHI